VPEPDGEHGAIELTAYLAERDVDCPVCGYNLRGVPGRVCPECGRPIRLPARPPVHYIFWKVGLAGMLLTYSALAVLAASVAFGHLFVGLIAALFLCEAPFRLGRWRRTKRAFEALPTYKKQQIVAGWWLAFGLAGLLAAQWMFGRL
jgi:hypothetical protein